MIERLLAAGAKLQVHDPEAIDNVRRRYARPAGIRRACRTRRSSEAEALLIMTEWKEFVQPDFQRMHKLMRAPVIFDGRNFYDPATLQQAGFTYHSIGRMPVLAGQK